MSSLCQPLDSQLEISVVMSKMTSREAVDKMASQVDIRRIPNQCAYTIACQLVFNSIQYLHTDAYIFVEALHSLPLHLSTILVTRASSLTPGAFRPSSLGG